MINSVDIPAGQRQYYDQLFKIADADGDGFIGLNDSAFFRKSNLPNTVLGEVWQLSDSRKEGRLDKEDFVVALTLISLAQQGKRLGHEAIRTPGVPPPTLMDIPPMSVPPVASKPSDWVISPQERKQYVDLFRANDDDGDGFITGVQARNLFSTSGLPLQLLGQIWLMADMNKDQKLDPHEFVIAMFLIANRKRGFELPTVVPESLIASAWPEPTSPTHAAIPSQPALSVPKGNEWVIPPSEKVKYDDLFKKTDTDIDGFISGEQARNLFLRSGVPLSELSRIWMLSDINQDQKLDKQEFAIAMFLIHCRIKGRDIPTPLPEALVNSARDDFVPTSSGSVTLPSKSDKSRYDIVLDEVSTSASPVVASVPSPNPPPSVPPVTISPSAIQSLPTETSHPHSASLEGTRKFNSATNLFTHSQGSGSLPQPGPAHGGQFLTGGTNSVGSHSPAVSIGLSPAVSSAPGVLQPGAPSFTALSPQFGTVNLVPNAALDIERTRQSIMHHEKTKTDMTEQLKDTTVAANETQRILEEELARKDALVAEIGELETQIGAQRARGNMYKDNITAIRLEVKNMATQKDQLEELLKEKRLQCEDQEQILADLRIELDEKTNEAEKYKLEIDQLKARLEVLRKETADVKNQLAAAKKHITDNKSEVNRLTEETKALKVASVSNVSSSPPPNTRAASPAILSYPNTPTLPVLHPPRNSLPNSLPTSAVSSPAIPHVTNSLTNSPTTTPFTFPSSTTDTFSFDNGREDPFAFSGSKDGFGLSSVTTDSFGPPAPLQGSPSPSRPTPEAPVFSNDTNSFFGTNEAFGDSKDPFTSSSGSDSGVSSDPFATSFAFGGAVASKDAFDSFGGSSGSVTQESFGSAASSVSSSFVPPTPHNTVIGERKGGLSGADIASAFSAAAFGGENGAETTSSFFGTNDETFGSSAFGSTTNDSFGGTSDAFGSSHEPFGRTESLRTSGGFANRGSGAFHSVDANEQKRGSGAFHSVDANEQKRGSGAFDSHKSEPAHPFGNDAFGSSDAFGTADAFGTTKAFGNSGDGFGTNDAFGSGGVDAFGSSDAFGNGNDVFGKSDAFGTSSAFETGSKALTSSGGSANGVSEDNRFGDDVFGKTDGFGTFNFTTDKKDGFDF